MQSAGQTFSFRAGVRIRGSIVSCDATAGSGLIFLSRAQSLDRSARRKLPKPRVGRRQVLLTEGTLALLGVAGERLRRQALIANVGRPFTLGELRLELFPSGTVPGGASLLCETGGRRVVYAGATRLGVPALGALPAQVRQADAVCLDATFASPRFTFPDRDEALQRVLRFVEAQMATGRSPVLLVPPLGAAMDVADCLAHAGHRLRAHRAIVGAAAAYARAGVAVPSLPRFDGELHRAEVLLWPPEHREAPLLGRLDAAFALVSGWAADSDAVQRARVDEAVPFAVEPDLSGLLRYAEATGAAEVAVTRGFVDQACRALQERGHRAYVLGPPRQIELSLRELAASPEKVE